jgi:hypothetical protein
MSEQIPDRSLHEDSNSQHPSLGVRLAGSSAYGAIKAAVETFTRYAAKEDSRPSSTRTAHDHPFACALFEEIHPNKVTARVFSVPNPLFADTAIGQGKIVEHLHAHWSNFKGQEFVVEGLKIV